MEEKIEFTAESRLGKALQHWWTGLEDYSSAFLGSHKKHQHYIHIIILENNPLTW